MGKTIDYYRYHNQHKGPNPEPWYIDGVRVSYDNNWGEGLMFCTKCSKIIRHGDSNAVISKAGSYPSRHGERTNHYIATHKVCPNKE